MKRIAIVGAGIGGLTLAAALNKHAPGVDVHLFERDDSRDARPQGYAISLRGDMGLKVLDELSLSYEGCGFPGKSFRFTTSSGRVLMNLAPVGKASSYYVYQVRRPDLRGLLLGAAGENTQIHYGTLVTRYENLESSCRLHLSDGGFFEADFVVVADGAKSRLRRQHTGVTDESRLGIGLITAKIPNGMPTVEKFNVNETLFMLGRGESLFAASSEVGSAAWSFGLHVTPELQRMSAQELLDHAKRRLASWAQPAGQLLAATKVEDVHLRELLDVQPLANPVDGRVVFIGDACHPMTPFQGLGANSAMLDAMDVALAIKELEQQQRNRDEVLRELATNIAQRGSKCVAASRASALTFHETNWLWGAWRNTSYWLLGTLLSVLPSR